MNFEFEELTIFAYPISEAISLRLKYANIDEECALVFDSFEHDISKSTPSQYYWTLPLLSKICPCLFKFLIPSNAKSKFMQNISTTATSNDIKTYC